MTAFISEMTDLLARTPEVLRVLLLGLPEVWTDTPDVGDGWRHDLDHVSQIYAGLAGSHDAAVGPWKAYTGILLRRDDPSAVAG